MADQGLTNAEKAALSFLVEAWNAWCSVPGRSADDNADFRAAIHSAQNQIAMRVAHRVNPEVWRSGRDK